MSEKSISTRRSVFLVLSVIAITVFAGVVWKSFKKHPSTSLEQASLDILEPYGVRFKTNDAGHVIELFLEGEKVDDTALSQLPNFPMLKGISLFRASITNEGMVYLKDLMKLETIGLGQTKITRKGLVYLERLPALRCMWISESDKLTAKEIENFRMKAVPGLAVFKQ